MKNIKVKWFMIYDLIIVMHLIYIQGHLDDFLFCPRRNEPTNFRPKDICMNAIKFA